MPLGLLHPSQQKFWTLQQHGSSKSALGGGDQCMALQYGKGIYFLHYVMVVCLFLMLTIILIAKLLRTSLINDKITKQKH
jgi:hypothetical protein